MSQPLAKIEPKRITISINRIREHDSNKYYLGRAVREPATSVLPFIPSKAQLKYAIPTQDAWSYLIVDKNSLHTIKTIFESEELSEEFKKIASTLRNDAIVVKSIGLVKPHYFVIYKLVETWEVSINEEDEGVSPNH